MQFASAEARETLWSRSAQEDSVSPLQLLRATEDLIPVIDLVHGFQLSRCPGDPPPVLVKLAEQIPERLNESKTVDKKGIHGRLWF